MSRTGRGGRRRRAGTVARGGAATPSRRDVLRLGAAALAAAAAGARPGWGRARSPIRIGFVAPMRTGQVLVTAEAQGIAGAQARRGALFADEAAADGAVEVLIANAPDAAAAARAAARLVAADGAAAIVGGIGPGQATLLADAAGARGVPFVDVGSTDPGLRRGGSAVHLMPDEPQALRAAALPLVGEGVRRWAILYHDTEDGRGRRSRAEDALAAAARELGVRPVDLVGVGLPEQRADVARVLPAVADRDALLMLVPWGVQLDVVEQASVVGTAGALVAAPDPVVLTRTFALTALERMRRPVRLLVPSPWDPTLRSGTAPELNDRFRSRWAAPLDGPAWLAYAGVRVATTLAGGATDGAAGRGARAGPGGPAEPLDLGKGTAATIDAVGQVHQELYLTEVVPGARRAEDAARVVATVPAA